MGKQVNSEIDKFPGYVVLPYPMTLPQALEYEALISDVAADESEYTILQTDVKVVEFLTGIVEEWHIEGILEHPTVETFPATPRRDSAMLIGWLIGEIASIYNGETIPDPNG